MHRHDWFGKARRWLLASLGLESKVFEREYVGHLIGNDIDAAIEEFERVLHEQGFTRNAPAWYKRNPDGFWSVGSWVYLPDGYFGDYQVHITIFPEGDIYVHREYNWRRHPKKHLSGEDFSAPNEKWRSRLESWGAPLVVRE